MSVSPIGSSDTVLAMQRAAAGMEAPLTAIKQQENAALALAQVLPAGQAQPQPAQQTNALNGLGQVLNISA